MNFAPFIRLYLCIIGQHYTTVTLPVNLNVRIHEYISRSYFETTHGSRVRSIWNGHRACRSSSLCNECMVGTKCSHNPARCLSSYGGSACCTVQADAYCLCIVTRRAHLWGLYRGIGVLCNIQNLITVSSTRTLWARLAKNDSLCLRLKRSVMHIKGKNELYSGK